MQTNEFEQQENKIAYKKFSYKSQIYKQELALNNPLGWHDIKP